jgi:hypothetical protein
MNDVTWTPVEWQPVEDERIGEFAVCKRYNLELRVENALADVTLWFVCDEKIHPDTKAIGMVLPLGCDWRLTLRRRPEVQP